MIRSLLVVTALVAVSMASSTDKNFDGLITMLKTKGSKKRDALHAVFRAKAMTNALEKDNRRKLAALQTPTACVAATLDTAKATCSPKAQSACTGDCVWCNNLPGSTRFCATSGSGSSAVCSCQVNPLVSSGSCQPAINCRFTETQTVGGTTCTVRTIDYKTPNNCPVFTNAATTTVYSSSSGSDNFSGSGDDLDLDLRDCKVCNKCVDVKTKSTVCKKITKTCTDGEGQDLSVIDLGLALIAIFKTQCTEQIKEFDALPQATKDEAQKEFEADAKESCPKNPPKYSAPSAKDCDILDPDNLCDMMDNSVLTSSELGQGAQCSSDADCAVKKVCYADCTNCFEDTVCDGYVKEGFLAAKDEKACISSAFSVGPASLLIVIAVISVFLF